MKSMLLAVMLMSGTAAMAQQSAPADTTAPTTAPDATAPAPAGGMAPSGSTSPSGSMATPAPAMSGDAAANYPRCSATVTDKCMDSGMAHRSMHKSMTKHRKMAKHSKMAKKPMASSAMAPAAAPAQ